MEKARGWLSPKDSKLRKRRRLGTVGSLVGATAYVAFASWQIATIPDAPPTLQAAQTSAEFDEPYTASYSVPTGDPRLVSLDCSFSQRTALGLDDHFKLACTAPVGITPSTTGDVVYALLIKPDDRASGNFVTLKVHREAGVGWTASLPGTDAKPVRG